MRKKERHQLIRQILEDNTVQKQEDLVAILLSHGADVTQATISRDMKEMHLVKVPTESGDYRYSVPIQYENDAERKFARLMQDAFVALHVKDYFVILKSIPGNAQALSAFIDQLDFQGVLGTVAGDDTILIICETQEKAEILERQLLQFIG